MPKTVLHFDAVDGKENYDIEFYNRARINENQTASHSFNTKLTLNTPIEKVKSITLVSCEIPFSWFNCRAENFSNSLSFTIVYGGITTNLYIYLNPKNYVSINDLIGDINYAITARSAVKYPNLVNFQMIFSLNPVNSSKIVVKANGDMIMANDLTCGAVVINKSVLASMMGISFNRSIALPDLFIHDMDLNFAFLYASGSYTLQPDNYALLNFTNIRKSSSGANNRMSSFKIVLNGSFGEVLSYEPQYKQTIQLEDQLLDHLNIRITDRNGYSIYGNGSFLSFSLEIET